MMYPLAGNVHMMFAERRFKRLRLPPDFILNMVQGFTWKGSNDIMAVPRLEFPIGTTVVNMQLSVDGQYLEFLLHNENWSTINVVDNVPMFEYEIRGVALIQLVPK